MKRQLPPELPIRSRVQIAVTAFNEGRHDEARKLCEQGLRHHPREPSLNHLLAAILFASGDVGTARLYVEASIAERANSAPAQLLAGRIARVAGDLEAALAHLDRALALARTGEALLERARTLEAAGRREAARNAWQALLRFNPRSFEAAARIGRLSWEDGRHSEALAMLERAVTGENAPASAWFDLAMVRQDLHDLAGAATAYRKALELRSDFHEAALNLGVVLQDAGDLDAAIEAYRTAYRLHPSTFGVIATALTSAPSGRLWIDRDVLRMLLAG